MKRFIKTTIDGFDAVIVAVANLSRGSVSVRTYTSNLPMCFSCFHFDDSPSAIYLRFFCFDDDQLKEYFGNFGYYELLEMHKLSRPLYFKRNGQPTTRYYEL